MDLKNNNIWDDNWLPHDEMMRPYGCLVPSPSVLVLEVIDNMSATWDKQLVEQVFMSRLFWEYRFVPEIWKIFGAGTLKEVESSP